MPSLSGPVTRLRRSQLRFIPYTSGGVSRFYQTRCVSVLAQLTGVFTLYTQQPEDERASDPFRRLLIQAVQWATNLRDRVEKKVAAVLTRAELQPNVPAPALLIDVSHPPSTPTFAASTAAFVASATSSSTDGAGPPAGHASSAVPDAVAPSPSVPSATSSATDGAGPPAGDMPSSGGAGPSVSSAVPNAADSTPGPPPLKPGRADHILRERCPACFNLNEWGRDLKECALYVHFECLY